MVQLWGENTFSVLATADFEELFDILDLLWHFEFFQIREPNGGIKAPL